MTRLFAYGSLLNPYVQIELWGQTKRGPVAEVSGCYVDTGGEFPRLRSAPVFGVSALGRVLELNHDELTAAVEYEGEMYSLQTVVLSDLTEAVSFL